jgi:hypothetical protein
VATLAWLIMLGGLWLAMLAIRRAFFRHEPQSCPRCLVRQAAAAEDHAVLRARAILSTKGD